MIKEAVERSCHDQSRYYIDIFIENLRNTLKSLARIVGVLAGIRNLHLQPGSLCHCSPFYIFLGQLLGTHVLDALICSKILLWVFQPANREWNVSIVSVTLRVRVSSLTTLFCIVWYFCSWSQKVHHFCQTFAFVLQCQEPSCWNACWNSCLIRLLNSILCVF